MKRRTQGLLLGSLAVAMAVLAVPVATSAARPSPTSSVRMGWIHTSRSDNYADDTWWAVRSYCPENYTAQRLVCAAVAVVVPAKAASNMFEAKLLGDTGLPLPERWGLATAKNSPFIRSVHVETPLDLAAVLGFYRAALGTRGWTEDEGTIVEPDRAVVAFATADGPALLRLIREDDRTIADLSLRKPAAAHGGFLPKPGRTSLLLGNKTDEEAVVTINGKTIRLAAHAGEDLVNSDDVAGQLPDGQKLDLPPGRYEVTLKPASGAAQHREFEAAANETWGLLAGPDGAPLAMRLY